MAKMVKFNSMMERKHMGTVPATGTILRTNLDLINAYNIYNYFYGVEDSVKFVKKYVGANFDFRGMPTTLGWMVDMHARGVKLPAETVTKMNAMLAKLPVQKEVVTAKIIPFKRDLVLDRLVTFFDNAIDTNLFDPKKIELSAAHRAKLLAKYSGILSEMTSSDEQFKEAYKNVSPKELHTIRNIVRFLEGLPLKTFGGKEVVEKKVFTENSKAKRVVIYDKKSDYVIVFDGDEIFTDGNAIRNMTRSYWKKGLDSKKVMTSKDKAEQDKVLETFGTRERTTAFNVSDKKRFITLNVIY